MARKHIAEHYIKSIEMAEGDVKKFEDTGFLGSKINKEKARNIAIKIIDKVGYSVLEELLNRHKSKTNKPVPSKNKNLPENIFEIENYDRRVYVIGFDVEYEGGMPIAIEYYEKTDIPNLELRLNKKLSSEAV